MALIRFISKSKFTNDWKEIKKDILEIAIDYIDKVTLHIIFNKRIVKVFPTT